MSELTELAFLLCLRALEKGLKENEIFWLVEQQMARIEWLACTGELDGGDGNGLGAGD